MNEIEGILEKIRSEINERDDKISSMEKEVSNLLERNKSLNMKYAGLEVTYKELVAKFNKAKSAFAGATNNG